MKERKSKLRKRGKLRKEIENYGKGGKNRGKEEKIKEREILLNREKWRTNKNKHG